MFTGEEAWLGKTGTSGLSEGRLSRDFSGVWGAGKKKGCLEVGPIMGVVSSSGLTGGVGSLMLFELGWFLADLSLPRVGNLVE